MKSAFGKTIVISLGGSIVHPGELNIRFLKKFHRFILRWLKQGRKFVIVVGGGSVAREYQEGAGGVVSVSNEDKDWIGIHATRLNAHLLRTMFSKYADPIVHDARLKRKQLRYPVTIVSGWRPGWSTDFVAVQMAVDFGVNWIINAGKPAYVYTRDNKKFSDAKPILHLSWAQYRRIIPKIWKPGLHTPVDPVAARLAQKKKISAYIICGTDLKNFERVIAGEDFKGTVIC